MVVICLHCGSAQHKAHRACHPAWHSQSVADGGRCPCVGSAARRGGAVGAGGVVGRDPAGAKRRDEDIAHGLREINGHSVVPASTHSLGSRGASDVVEKELYAWVGLRCAMGSIAGLGHGAAIAA